MKQFRIILYSYEEMPDIHDIPKGWTPHYPAIPATQHNGSIYFYLTLSREIADEVISIDNKIVKKQQQRGHKDTEVPIKS